MDSVDVRFVLVETSHPGNIGGAARAMKNMCLDQLALVNPNRYPSADATSRASGADDILMNASLHETLDQALEGCALVVGTSARPRGLYIPELTPKQLCRENSARSASGQGGCAVWARGFRA